jgi:hypothetical protein
MRARETTVFEALPGTKLYVKPSNYKQKTKRKYRMDISHRENLVYDVETDS